MTTPWKPPNLPPVDIDGSHDDAVAHSLYVLGTVYHYNHWIYCMIRDFLGPAVLEVGAGTGNITQFLLNLGEVHCLEPWRPYREYLKSRFSKHLNVCVRSHRIEDCPNGEVRPGNFDSVVCLNVLEHVVDDVKALSIISKLLRPEGRAIVLVPALQCISGEMDRAMGHLRRYTLRSLGRAFVAAGLRPIYKKYMNLAGVPAWWWRGCVRKKMTIPESQTRFFDRLVPFLSAMERIVPVPLGQSAVMVGTR